MADQVKKKLDKHGCYCRLYHVVLDGGDGVLTLTWDYENQLLDRERHLLGKYVLATSLDRETHDAEAALEFYKSRHQHVIQQH